MDKNEKSKYWQECGETGIPRYYMLTMTLTSENCTILPIKDEHLYTMQYIKLEYAVTKIHIN